MVIEECRGLVDEIIVVDDGSTDKSFEVAKRYGVRVFRNRENLGKVAALRRGVAEARGEIVIFMDGDFTYPGRYIPEFIEKIESGFDLVLGSRFKGEPASMPFLNRMGNRLFSLVASYLGCVDISDGQTGFRAFRREKFPELDVEARSLEYETKMTVRAAKLGYNIFEIPIEYRKRVGRSKLRPIRDGFSMFWGLVSLVWRETSLVARAVIFPGLVFLVAGLVFGGVSIYEKLEYGVLKHAYYPMITTVLILVSVQAISVGLVVDYLAKKLDRIEEKLR